jgi:hypothetical protein
LLYLMAPQKLTVKLFALLSLNAQDENSNDP